MSTTAPPLRNSGGRPFSPASYGERRCNRSADSTISDTASRLSSAMTLSSMLSVVFILAALCWTLLAGLSALFLVWRHGHVSLTKIIALEQ